SILTVLVPRGFEGMRVHRDQRIEARALLIVAFDTLQQTLREFRARQKPCAKRAWMSAILSSVTDDCGFESAMASPVVDTAGAQPRLHADRGGHGTRHGSFPVKALCDAIPPCTPAKGEERQTAL